MNAQPKTRRRYESKITEALIDEIVKYIRIGCYIETAIVLAGINKDTFYKWCRQGHEEKRGLKRLFLERVTKALAEAELRDIAYIDKAIQNGVWQAAAWRLERKFPTRWGKRDHLEIEHIVTPDGGALPLASLTVEEIQKNIIKINEQILKRLSSINVYEPQS